MPYYDSETIERARQVDLLTYLQTCEPQELVHVSGNVYCTKTHDSLRISNGKWCWFSRGIGGYSALDYLIKVNGYSFMDAMETITGRAAIRPPSFVPAPKEEKPKHLLLPQAAPDNRAMVDYLKKRGIDPGVIDYCIQTGRLYESRNKGHSNVVFVGFDKDGKARFGCLRGIGEGRFHGDLSGSDKHYSFALPACVENPAVHLCESAIDVMSYGEQNPIVEKSQFIMSLIEQIDKTGVGPQHKSIIDRCTALVYQDAERTGRIATLCDLREKLLEQPEEKAKDIALSLELFTTGSLDIFGRESTVDLDKRVVVFDIRGLGQQLKPTGLLVITDTILNRVTLNWKRGKRTHVFLDEFHVVFENEQSGVFFNSAWRQFRKRGAYPTAITQNVEYLLDSVQASTMLSNSEFIVMLNQAASDREKLAKLLNISKEQMSYVTNADAGCGLIRYGSALVPFINRFPRDTKLYELMTTKPGEGVFGGEKEAM